jgi:hypothetical protein
MNKRQATKIQRLLFEVNDAVHQASVEIFKLERKNGTYSCSLCMT